MKKIFLNLLILPLAFNIALAQATIAPAKKAASEIKTTLQPAQKQQGQESPFVNKVLPNGLEVIVIPDSSVPIVTVELVARNGSFTEPLELNGLSHLYEHMFFKTNKAIGIFKCKKHEKARNLEEYKNNNCNSLLEKEDLIGDIRYLEEMDQYGTTNNGETHEEHVNYYYTTTSNGLSSIMRYMNDAVRYPIFDDQEFKREIEVVIGELDRNLSNPYYYLDRTLMDKLFYKYPTRKSPGGTRETVRSATTEKMRTIQNRYYVPNNMALIIAGDAEPQKAFKLAEEIFGSWKKREVDPFKEFPLVDHPPLPKSEGIIVEQPVQDVIIQIGWHGPSIGKDDTSTYAADVFSFIIEQPNSRFQRALVESGLAVGVDFHYYTQRNVGPIRATLSTTPEKAKAALKALHGEIAKFDAPDYFTDEELQNAITIVEAQDLFSREKLSEYAHVVGFWWSATGIDYFKGYHKNLRAITRQEIKRYVTTYVKGKPRIGVALISEESQAIAKLAPSDLTGQ